MRVVGRRDLLKTGTRAASDESREAARRRSNGGCVPIQQNHTSRANAVKCRSKGTEDRAAGGEKKQNGLSLDE